MRSLELSYEKWNSSTFRFELNVLYECVEDTRTTLLWNSPLLPPPKSWSIFWHTIMLQDGLFPLVYSGTLQCDISVQIFKMTLHTETLNVKVKPYFGFGKYSITKIRLILVHEDNNSPQIKPLTTCSRNVESHCDEWHEWGLVALCNVSHFEYTNGATR
jgi:hypothetical protein